MLIGMGGPSAVLMWVVYTLVREIRPALDRNTEALGAVAQALGKPKAGEAVGNN